jgi:hypothetical protein
MQLIQNGVKKGWLWRILIACLAWAFYIVLVVGVNTILETGDSTVAFAKGALSLISVVAAIILAVRAQYKNWLAEKREERQERREERLLRKQTAPVSIMETARRRTAKADILAYLAEHPEDAGHPGKVAAMLEMPVGTVKATISRMRKIGAPTL